MHKILIVEDEIAISQVLKAYLKKAGYETKQVYTGKEAIDAFHEYKPDLVLLDVMLPGKNGKAAGSRHCDCRDAPRADACADP